MSRSFLWLIVVFVLKSSVYGQQQFESIYAPSRCSVEINYPQSSNLNYVEWEPSHIGMNMSYYIFYTDLSLIKRNIYIVAPYTADNSYFWPYSTEAEIYYDFEINKNYDVYMMAYYPLELCLYPGHDNCPYSKDNRTCTVQVNSPNPTTRPTYPTTRAPTTRAPTTHAPTTRAPTTRAPTTKSPTDGTPFPTRDPSPSPTYNKLSATSTTLTTESYTSSGINYQHGIITCGKQSYCEITCNSANRACNGLLIDASAANYLIINCDTNKQYEYACEGMVVDKPPKTDATIYCYGARSCHYGTFILTDLSTVTIEVDGNDNIFGAYPGEFILNGTTTVNVHCINDNGCYGADFYLKDVTIFILDVDGEKAAYAVNIYAQDIAANYKAANFQINCNVYRSCYYANVFAPDNERTITINCNAPSACEYMDACIPSITYENLNINCAASYNTSCAEVSFYCMDTFTPDDIESSFVKPRFYSSITYDADIKGYGCFDTDYGCCPIVFKHGRTFPKPQKTSFSVDCQNTFDCQSAVMDLSVAESVTVYCTADNSCKGIAIYGPTSALTVECVGIDACRGAYIDARETQSTTITCSGDQACWYQRVLYPDADFNAKGNKLSGSLYCFEGDKVCSDSQYVGNGITNMLMSCATKGTTLSTYYGVDGNCYRTYGNFSNSEVSVLCDKQNDCAYTQWTFDELSTATIICDGSYSCYAIKIYAYNAKQINTQCFGSLSCTNIDIQCPSIIEDGCGINCNGNYSCKFLDIYANQNWILQYLDLECDTTKKQGCDIMQMHCPFDIIDIGEPVTDILYDSNGIFSCDPDNNADCCPFNTYSPTPSPTSIPTVPPSRNPTISPTRFPTINPTISPTSSPTDTTLMPSKSPSNNPSKSPSNIPSQSPTTGHPVTTSPIIGYSTQSDGDNTDNASLISIKHNVKIAIFMLVLAIFVHFV